MYLIHDENPDPGFRFESLLRAIFDNCNKYGDPWGYAAQDVYNSFVPNPTIKGKRALSTGLTKLIYDNKDNENIKIIIELEEQLWSATTQEEIIKIIDVSIDWIKANLI
ncbi:hypothetical protein [Sunxiuqinia rutila]|uniref:hypothetical protein n=1 Tax=Sunxiuqinia rutila TaxID=1397841 RepID=UPI003D36561A